MPTTTNDEKRVCGMSTKLPSGMEIRKYFEERGFSTTFIYPMWQLDRDFLDCSVKIWPRPDYCDRGRVYMSVERLRTADVQRFTLDGADMWPRLYFHPETAWQEMFTWLTVRKQWLETDPEYVIMHGTQTPNPEPGG